MRKFAVPILLFILFISSCSRVSQETEEILTTTGILAYEANEKIKELYEMCDELIEHIDNSPSYDEELDSFILSSDDYYYISSRLEELTYDLDILQNDYILEITEDIGDALYIVSGSKYEEILENRREW